MPYFKRMHEMTVDHVHEEIQLLAIDVSTMLFETPSLMPSWRDVYRAERPDPLLRVPAHRAQGPPVAAGGSRWVLKSPQHLEQFGPLRPRLPRRHLRGHPPGSRGGDRVDGHDGGVHRPHARRAGRPAGHRPLLVGSGSRTSSAPVPGTGSCCPTAADHRRPLRRIHGRRPGHGAGASTTVADQPFSERSPAGRSPVRGRPPRGRHGTVVYQPAVLGIDTAPSAAWRSTATASG